MLVYQMGRIDFQHISIRFTLSRESRNAYMREYRARWTPEQKEQNREWQRKYRNKARDRIKAKNRAAYSENPKIQLTRSVESANNNPERTLWQSARANAKVYGREFSIEISDIIIPNVCPFFGTPMKVARGQGINPYAPSVDRVDSSLGYIKGNIQVISKKANVMKSNATKEELIKFAKYILATYEE